MATGRVVDKALNVIRGLPRVTLGSLKDGPGARTKPNKRRSQHKGNTCGRPKNGQGATGRLPRLGFEGGNTPFYLMIPKEPYYKDHYLRREYPPLSLLQLQRMIDLNRVDSTQLIDVGSICNTGLYRLQIEQKQFGINLTEEGVDSFKARINIEVQWTSELVIAAIERNGGMVTTRYYNPESLMAISNPLKFFKQGSPIPLAKTPPADVIEYYSNAKNRGYLADPEEIRKERYALAQKYGYTLPEITEEMQEKFMSERKDPRQVFVGLQPGWVVNLKDKCVLKPVDREYEDFYKS